jgi:K+-sensing histidine kinase KdpD
MNGVIKLFETILPIFVVVVLPVMVVWLVTRARLKKNEQKMAVLVKAIENGVDIDPALLVSETEGGRNTKMKLVRKLTTGVICAIIGLAVLICTQLDAFEGVAGIEMLYIIGGVLIAVGAAYILAFFVGRKYLAPEIEAEEKKLQK